MEINERLMLALLLIGAGVAINLLIRCVDRIDAVDRRVGFYLSRESWRYPPPVAEESKEPK